MLKTSSESLVCGTPKKEFSNIEDLIMDLYQSDV